MPVTPAQDTRPAATPMAAAPSTAPAWPDWWATPGVLARFVADLITDEAARLRPGGAGLPPRPWPDDLALDTSGSGLGLGLDSLERLTVASALAESLHLHDSGLEDLLLARRTLGEWVVVADESLQQASGRLTFRTSGSSGQPKPCTHALAALQQEVDHLATLFPAATRVLATVPAHHIYGFLFSVLLPARLGLAPALDLRLATPQSLAQQLRAGDLLISHPTHWALLARHGGRLPAGVVGVSSTAPCPDALAEALAEQGLARLVQVYGSSETAGIGWRDVAASAYRLMPHWQRADAVAGSSRDPQTASSWLTRTAPDGQTTEHPLQDHLDWADASHFRVGPRRDAAVQVAGVNVFPDRVRQVLLAHPQVQDAAVRLMQPAEGQRLKAFIVPRAELFTTSHAAALREDLARWVASRLSVPEQPKAFRFGAGLPVNAMGKACDWAVAPEAGQQPIS